MNKTGIEWCTRTWNPTTGCLHACEYCYARKIAQRFGGCDSYHKTAVLHEELIRPKVLDCPAFKNSKEGIIAPYPYDFTPTFHRYRLDEPQAEKKPQNIFVGSMADLFGEWVPDEWIKAVFEATNDAPWHRYLYLTKNPARYFQLGEGDSALIPSNGVVGLFGASAETEEAAQKAWENLNCEWISLEPLHGEFSEEFFAHDNRYTQDTERRWAWVVIGAETGNRKGKIKPERTWIEEILEACRCYKTPVFLKNNLATIWGEPLIQEYPWEAQNG